jgi:hypothetical protein
MLQKTRQQRLVTSDLGFATFAFCKGKQHRLDLLVILGMRARGNTIVLYDLIDRTDILFARVSEYVQYCR